MNERSRPLIAAIVCVLLSGCMGCVELAKAIHFPERRPADPTIQAISDRLTAAAGADPVEVTVWGNLEYPRTVRYPIAVIAGCDEILVHESVATYFRDKPDALATLFGHELGHRLAGYKGEPRGEIKADVFGVITAAKAGFDPWVGAVWVCAFFKANDRGIENDPHHPPPDERCRALMIAAVSTGVPLIPGRLPKRK